MKKQFRCHKTNHHRRCALSVERVDYRITDKKIDQLVYELYGLTEEEIKIVEGEK